MSSVTAVSVSEYLKTSYDPNCEYIDGVLVPKPMPTWRHSRVQGKIFSLIDSRFPDFLVGTELTVQVSAKRFLVPDLAVQAASMVQDPYPTKPIVLCVEILSPDDSLTQTLAKCEEYHEWGTPDTWVIDLVSSAAQEVDQSGELHAGPIHLPLADIFK